MLLSPSQLSSTKANSFRNSYASSSKNLYMSGAGNEHSESNIQVPKPSYVVIQQHDATMVLSETQFEYPNDGPKVEVLLQSKIGIKGGNFSIKNTQALMGYLEKGGVENSIEMVTDIEHTIIQPFNRLFLQYYSKFQKIEVFYMIVIITILLIVVMTMGFGVGFILLMFIPPFLKYRHVKDFGNIKEEIRTILERENQEKYLPFNMEWVIQYGISPPEENDQVLDGKCIQNATIQLLRVKINTELKDELQEV